VLCYIYVYDFYNIIFKIKHKIHIASGSTSPTQMKISGYAPGTVHSVTYYVYRILGWKGGVAHMELDWLES
jgi:hypothetical protein